MQILKRFFAPENSFQLKVIITGPPRAGTSFLAGLINRLGYHAGPDAWIKPADEHNRYGYYECQPLKKISNQILEKFGGDFMTLPEFPAHWLTLLNEEKAEIRRIVHQGRIEMYKENRLVVLADLYDELYPDAKWIFINRDVQETYRSRFGDPLSFEDWQALTAKRLAHWQNSQPSKTALHLDYADFRKNAPKTLNQIAEYLEITLTQPQQQSALDFFRPRQ